MARGIRLAVLTLAVSVSAGCGVTQRAPPPDTASAGPFVESPRVAADRAREADRGFDPTDPDDRRLATPAMVREMQLALARQGYDPGPIDGLWGPSTQAALLEYQQAQGLGTGDELDPDTLAALGVDEAPVPETQAALD